jgi:hypothetical protein
VLPAPDLASMELECEAELRPAGTKRTGAAIAPEVAKTGLVRGGSAVTDDSRVARLLREVAQGYSPPARRARPTREEEEDNIFRDLLADSFEISRRMQRQRSGLDLEALRWLYTARSFSSPEELGRTTRALRVLLDSNLRAASQMRRAVARVKGRIEATAWTSEEKQQFWKDVTEGFTNRFQIREELLDRQREWTEATIELYEFVLANSEGLVFEGRRVRSREEDTGQEFLRLLDHARGCREGLRRDAAEADAEHESLLEKWGFSDALL